MERFKALAEKWRKQGDGYRNMAAEARSDFQKSFNSYVGDLYDLVAAELDYDILATENEAFMESIVPGFKDLDDVVATDAAQAVKEQTL